MKNNYYIVVILSVIILVQSRILPHPPNFTPILAIGIFSGFYFKKFYLSFFILILSMFIGDIYLGFHNTMFFTYAALSIPVMMGLFINKLKITSIFSSSLLSSICFFLITNFGAWITLDMYEKNLSGLINSYILAIPFFHNTLISTFLFLFLFKFLFELLIDKKLIKN